MQSRPERDQVEAHRAIERAVSGLREAAAALGHASPHLEGDAGEACAAAERDVCSTLIRLEELARTTYVRTGTYLWR